MKVLLATFLFLAKVATTQLYHDIHSGGMSPDWLDVIASYLYH